MPDQFEDKMMAQQSVDYLNQINTNIIALNASASAQRQITERQLQVQDQTKSLIDEQKQTVASQIQNQAYMAYGSVQHDMKNLVGVTDETTRTAMTTMMIAGNNAVQDVRQVGQMAANAAATGLVTAQDFFTPTVAREQGMVGDILGAVGLRRAPTTMYQQDFERSSRDSLRDRFRGAWYGIRSVLPTQGKYKNQIEREQMLNFMSPQLSGPSFERDEEGNITSVNLGGRLDREQREAIGTTMGAISQDLRRRGLVAGEDEAQAVLGIAARSESGVLRKYGGNTEDNIKEATRSIREFSEAAADMGRMFGKSAQDMARDLSDLRQLTGMDVGQMKEFLTNTKSQGSLIGLNAQQSMVVARQGINLVRGLGLQKDIEEAPGLIMTNMSAIQNRMDKDSGYRKFVARQYGTGAEGLMKAAQSGITSDVGFQRSDVGLLFTMAKQGGAQVGANTSLMDIQAAAASTAAGGPRNIFVAKYEQLFGDMDGVSDAKRNYYFRIYKTLFPKDEISKVKQKGTPEYKSFIGFLANMLGDDPTKVEDEYYQIFKQNISQDKEVEAMGGAYAQKREEDITGRKGLLETGRRKFISLKEGGYSAEEDLSQPTGKNIKSNIREEKGLFTRFSEWLDPTPKINISDSANATFASAPAIPAREDSQPQTEKAGESNAENQYEVILEKQGQQISLLGELLREAKSQTGNSM